MHKISRQDGFTITEMMVSTAVMLLVVGATLTTFKNAVMLNDAASQLGDSTQNLRAGTNLLTRDLLMAGRIFGAEGVALPTCAGAQTFVRPGPVAGLVFTTVAVDGSTMNLPSITTGFELGPVIQGSKTDMVTIMTVDEFMPVIITPPPVPAVNVTTEGTIAADGLSITLDANSPWVKKDTVNDTVPMKAGDLVLFKSANGNAIQTVTKVEATKISFEANDPFHFNQSCAAIVNADGTTTINWPMLAFRDPAVVGPPALAAGYRSNVTLFRALMTTYYVYVDTTVTPSAPPRLMRQINNWAPTALAGVVEDLDLTYDLVDGDKNPPGVKSLPWTDATQSPAVTYNSNQIRKVNVHVGVRSELMSQPTQDYVRNHISTSVDVRSLASVDRYKAAGEIQ